MKYTLTKSENVPVKVKKEHNVHVYPEVGDVGVVLANTETGHNEESYHRASTFYYIILEGSGTFFLDDEEVLVEQGDQITISPKTRIYYKGEMKLLLITDPAWREENEVETRNKIW